MSLSTTSWRAIIRQFLFESSMDYSINLGAYEITSSELHTQIRSLRKMLTKGGFYPLEGKVVGLALDGASWIFSDLLCLAEGAITVPVPLEFTDRQLASLLDQVDICLVSDRFAAGRLCPLLQTPILDIGNGQWYQKLSARGGNRKPLPKGTVKIIHTSGSTDDPKGVIVADQAIYRMVTKLSRCLGQLGKVRYGSTLPLSLLIEQILGVYLPILTGGTTYLPPTDLPPYSTASTEVRRYLEMIAGWSCNLTMLPPDLLTHLALAADECALRHISPLATLFPNGAPLIATGGATVPLNLVQQLTEQGFQILQGYGLSENTSVVAWNTCDEHRIGSVGRPLEGTKVRIRGGEVQVQTDTQALGYVINRSKNGGDSTALSCTEDGWLQTGDCGFLDDDGFLFVTGRLKNILALTSTRKVCPEWLEGIYRSITSVLHVIALGEGRQRPRAVFVLTNPSLDPVILGAEIEHAGTALPDFARLESFAIVKNNQSFLRNFFTITGRPRRDLVETAAFAMNWHTLRSTI